MGTTVLFVRFIHFFSNKNGMLVFESRAIIGNWILSTIRFDGTYILRREGVFRDLVEFRSTSATAQARLMIETSLSLLERLRCPTDQHAWQRFVELYTPLLFSWARRIGLQTHDAADLVQEVLTLLVKKLPEFQYDQNRSFRNWLHVILRNKCRDWKKKRTAWQRAELAAAVVDEDPEVDDTLSELEYRQFLIAAALRYVEREFSETVRQAFHEFAVLGRPAAAVAAELGMTENAVYLSKSRVLRRLKQELAGLLE